MHGRDDAVALPELRARESIEEESVTKEEAPASGEARSEQQLPIREAAAAATTESQAPSAEDASSETSTIAAPSEPETPATSQAPSESDFAQVSTPATPAQITTISPKPALPQQHARNGTRTAIAVPNIPGLPRAKDASPPSTASQGGAQKSESVKSEVKIADAAAGGSTAPVDTVTAEAMAPADEAPKPAAKPKSWADLVKVNSKPKTAAGGTNGQAFTNGIQLPKTAPLADALRQYSVQSDAKLAFLEPRGLVNTGNMCYMNSVRAIFLAADGKQTNRSQILQVLVFCAPFYNFLDQVRERTVHSMKSDTPLVDAMIMFMREFKVLASAETADGLRKLLKQDQLEMYGDAVTPDYVYDVIRKLPRFASMRVSSSRKQ